MEQDKLQSLLDSLDEGPLGRSQRHWSNIDKLEIARIVASENGVSDATKAKQSRSAKGRVNAASKCPKARAKASATLSRGIKAYSYPEMSFLGEFKNTKEAGAALGIHPSIVATVARGIYKQSKGMTFEYIEEMKSKRLSTEHTVEAFTYPDMKPVGTYTTLQEAGSKLGVKPAYIQAVLNPKRVGILSTGGFTFKKLTK